MTEAIDSALLSQDKSNFRYAIRENHQLLRQINVVPDRVAQFIHEIERCGGAAKVCGSGSVLGDSAGVVLVSSEQKMESLAKHYGYQLQTIEVDSDGTKII